MAQTFPFRSGDEGSAYIHVDSKQQRSFKENSNCSKRSPTCGANYDKHLLLHGAAFSLVALEAGKEVWTILL